MCILGFLNQNLPPQKLIFFQHMDFYLILSVLFNLLCSTCKLFPNAAAYLRIEGELFYKRRRLPLQELNCQDISLNKERGTKVDVISRLQMNSSMSTLLTTNQANPWYCPFGTKILHQSKRQTSLLKEIKNFALTESKSSPWKMSHQLKLEISPSVFQETLPRT